MRLIGAVLVLLLAVGLAVAVPTGLAGLAWAPELLSLMGTPAGVIVRRTAIPGRSASRSIYCFFIPIWSIKTANSLSCAAVNWSNSLAPRNSMLAPI